MLFNCVISQDTIALKGTINLNPRSNDTSYDEDDKINSREVYKNIEIYLNGNDKQYKSFPKRDGSFVIYNVQHGPYLMEISSPEFYFSPIRVDVSRKEPGKVRMKYTVDNSILPSPNNIQPQSRINYFQTSKNIFSVLSGLISNPIILLMGVMMILMMIIQKMDPEAMNELKKETDGESRKKPEDYMPHLLKR